jgi:hypothetical protein
MMGRMEGTPGDVERELLDLLWRLMHDRDLIDLKPPFADERTKSKLDQLDLQIVRCLALLALVRQDPPPPRDEDLESGDDDTPPGDT